MAVNKEVPERIQQILLQLIDKFDQEDIFVRERQIRTWKKLKFYWNNIQRIWWDEVAHDYRIAPEYNQNEDQAGANAYYDRPINIFRAYLETIISALSVTTPDVKCYPEDAENDLDLQTAKAGDRIFELVKRHIDGDLKWIHALFIYCTEGLIASYNYTRDDYAYGSYNEPKYEDAEEEVQTQVCSICKTQLPNQELENQEKDEYNPSGDDSILHGLMAEGKPVCPQCMIAVDPEIQTSKVIVQRMVGFTTKPKSRQCVEVKGGLNVKVPNWARCQEDCLYLIDSYETHWANILERWPHLRDKVSKAPKIGPGMGGTDRPYEVWGRLSTQYLNEFIFDTPTVKNCWFRPSAYNIIAEESDRKYLEKEFPDGVRCVRINEHFAEAENECMDDHWTLSKNPLSDYIHFDPIGLLLVSVQDITNDIISLTQQTMEHGIPQTFANPKVLNFPQYSETEVAPGAIFPATPETGKSMADAFYEVKTATLSGEVGPFAQKIQELGQEVSGALPSLSGGAQPNSSKTAAQYSMSRAQARQRLQTPWKMLNIWWKDTFGKVIPAYIKCVVEDEKFVKTDETGGFINVFVRKAELQGKIGSVELESSDQLPSDWGEKKDVIMQLMTLNDPAILAALTSPENVNLIKDAIGIDDFILPGENDRNKQYEEIQELIRSAPMPDIDPQTGMQIEVPSVDIEPIADNHQVEADICRSWIVSEAGRLAKRTNPKGYKNVLLHMQRHLNVLAMNVAPPQQGPVNSQTMKGNSNEAPPVQPPTIQ